MIAAGIDRKSYFFVVALNHQPWLSNRFELFIDRKEICNAYEGEEK